jgi:hypothetical protein
MIRKFSDMLNNLRMDLVLTMSRPEIMGEAHPVTNKLETHNVWMVSRPIGLSQFQHLLTKTKG